MARRAREKSSSGIYHVIMRGVNRQTIFEEDEDRVKFLSTLGRYKSKQKYELYGYALMSNHIHLLLREDEDTLADSIKRIASSYVHWYNQKYERCGHLFQERFKSEPVETRAYFLVVLRYIHQNPLKAHLVKRVDERQWTSYQAYMRGSKFIETSMGLSLFAKNKNEAKAAFEVYMRENNHDVCLEDEEKFAAKITDDELRAGMKRLGISNVSAIQQMDKEERDLLLRKLKRIQGVSLRQLSRVIGISKNIIERA